MTVRLLTQRYCYAFLLLLFTLLSFNSMEAQVTWIGGNSVWDLGANWDTGSVPTGTDEVIIPGDHSHGLRGTGRAN